MTFPLLVAYSQTRKTPRPPKSARMCPWLRWRIPALVLRSAWRPFFSWGFLSLAAGRPLGTALVPFPLRDAAGYGRHERGRAILLDYRPSTPWGRLQSSSPPSPECPSSFPRTAGPFRVRALLHREARMALLTPFILLYAASIILLGHLTPGGGLQGGSVFATVAILMCVVYGTGSRRPGFRRRARRPLKREGPFFSCS